MSRRKGRYERRKQAREERRVMRCQDLRSMEEIFSYRNMFDAGKKCCNGVRWKTSTQNYERHLFSQTAATRETVLSGAWKPSPYTHFTICERGKTREIDAPKISDRQVHKVITKNVLLPLYQPEMIWNNGASLPGKGLAFSQNELKEDLRWHFRRYGREGFIILIDFSNFFGSVPHKEIYKRHDKFLKRDDLKRLAGSVVDSTPGGYGMPLGVEPSQIEMIAFPSKLDNFIKCQLSIRGAGHYMDDYYIIVPSDRDPKEILNQTLSVISDLGLLVNRSKTRIVPLAKRFKFCKARYQITETGKIIVRCNAASIKADRRKIKTFARWFKEGKMRLSVLWPSINGMFAYLTGFNDHKRVLRLRRLFYALFGFSAERYENFKTREAAA